MYLVTWLPAVSSVRMKPDWRLWAGTGSVCTDRKWHHMFESHKQQEWTHTLICGQSVAASQETHTDRQSAWWEWRRCCSSLCSPLWVTIFITFCFLHQLTLILQLQHVKCQFVSLTLCWLQIPAALFTTDLFSDPLPSFYTLKLFWLNFEFR